MGELVLEVGKIYKNRKGQTRTIKESFEPRSPNGFCFMDSHGTKYTKNGLSTIFTHDDNDYDLVESLVTQAKNTSVEETVDCVILNLEPRDTPITIIINGTQPLTIVVPPTHVIFDSFVSDPKSR